MVGARSASRGVVIALVCLLVGSATASASSVAPGEGRSGVPPGAVEDLRPACQGDPDAVVVAEDLVANRYTMSGHATVTLPADPTWAENPLNDANWMFQFHSLVYVLDLISAWLETDDQRYLDRATFLLDDWSADNPRLAPPSPYSWNDHSTALRAVVLACAAEIGIPSATLQDALILHAETLADPTFYVGRGNHALNQSLGLLDIGCLLGRSDWKGLAARRINTLIGSSVDSQGVTNEQSVYYQYYNYSRYRYARSRLVECHQVPGPEFARIDKMPQFLTHATQPDGRYVMLGDTTLTRAVPIAGTAAEYAASQGKSGPKPVNTVATYAGGFAFARTGWGEKRAYADETYLSVRFGPPRQIHGHRDGTSITLYGYGTPLLVDPGLYAYSGGVYRSYFVSRAAHNLVTVDGAKQSTTDTTRRSWTRTSPSMYAIGLTGKPYSGVTARRTVALSRTSGYSIVDDRYTSTTRRWFRQLWHLREDAKPVLSGNQAWTRRSKGNVLIVQLVGPTKTRIVTGATNPIQGWISYHYRTKIPAPVVETRRSGTVARFITLLVPYRTTKPTVAVSDLRVTVGGFTATVSINGVRERVVMGATGSSITRLG